MLNECVAAAVAGAVRPEAVGATLAAEVSNESTAVEPFVPCPVTLIVAVMKLSVGVYDQLQVPFRLSVNVPIAASLVIDATEPLNDPLVERKLASLPVASAAALATLMPVHPPSR